MVNGQGQGTEGEVKRARGRVRAIVIGGNSTSARRLKSVEKAAHANLEEAQKALDGDGAAESNLVSPWEELERQGRIVPPPFDPFALAAMSEHSSDLAPSIEAMAVNVVGFGWQLVAVPSVARLLPQPGIESEEDKALDPLAVEALEELERFEEFLTYGNWDDESLTSLRRAQRFDLEEVGYAFMELIPNSQEEIVGYRHVPSYQMRLATLDEESTTYKDPRVIGSGKDRRIEKRTKRRRFRRYVQWDGGRAVVWFKEFGDPRPISKETGEVLTGEDAKDRSKLANPMIYRRLYAPRTPYGIPRYMGALLAILGGRAAEEVNYTTFRNNNIPSMMIMVSGGQLTADTVERIETFSKEVIQGDDNYSKFLILEAEADEAVDQGGTAQNVKIDAKPLTKDQITDAMFQRYEETNADKVRRAWRLPPILVGRSSDYTRATADTSRRLAEEQVFAPERQEEDWTWNRILRAMGLKFWEFRTNSPNVTDDSDLLQLLYAAEKAGAMTPRIARDLTADILGRPIPAPDSSVVNLDVPFSLQMAEAVKNQGDPGEVGQSVTALKSRGGLADLLGFRAELVRELKRKEHALRMGEVPGVFLRNGQGERLVQGIERKVVTTEKSETEGRTLAVVDEVHVLGFVQLTAPRAEGSSWVYDVVSAEEVTPYPHAGVDEGATFVGSVGIL